jgi:hypothetical protein
MNSKTARALRQAIPNFREASYDEGQPAISHVSQGRVVKLQKGIPRTLSECGRKKYKLAKKFMSA